MEGLVLVLMIVLCFVFVIEEICNDLEMSCYISLGCGNVLYNY